VLAHPSLNGSALVDANLRVAANVSVFGIILFDFVDSFHLVSRLGGADSLQAPKPQPASGGFSHRKISLVSDPPIRESWQRVRLPENVGVRDFAALLLPGKRSRPAPSLL